MAVLVAAINPSPANLQSPASLRSPAVEPGEIIRIVSARPAARAVQCEAWATETATLVPCASLKAFGSTTQC